MRLTRRMLLGIGGLLLLFGLPSVAAVTGESTTPIGDVIRPIFTQIVWVSTAIGVFVWGLLIFALIKFRQRKDGPTEAPQIHGNNKLEIAWTIAPALVMAWLLVISYNGMLVIEGPDRPDPEFTINVSASRFLWSFEYPDGSTSDSVLRVEQGRVVGLQVTTIDVIHAFRIAELDVMVDAMPGRQNYFWFQAREVGEYHAACFQFCGTGHGDMVATVVVFAAGEQDLPYGDMEAAGAPPPPPQPGTDLTPPPDADQVVEVDLSDFVIDAAQLTFDRGSKVAFQVRNEGPSPHNFYIGQYVDNNDKSAEFTTTNLNNGAGELLVAEFPDEDIAYRIWCDIPGHAQQGMLGDLLIGEALPAGSPTKEPILPGTSPLAFLSLLALATFWVRRRRA